MMVLKPFSEFEDLHILPIFLNQNFVLGFIEEIETASSLQLGIESPSTINNIL